MIAHTIEQAFRADCFDRVVVSTEDEEIATVARAAGADIHIREAGLATDAARVVDVCIAVLDSEALAGKSHQVFACLYATAPLRRAEDIRAVMALIDRGGAAFAMAVTTFPIAPHQALRVQQDGLLTPMWPELVERRASELDPLVVDNGSTYAAKVGAFRKHRSFYGPLLRGHVMPRERSVDIDEQSDYDLACWYAERPTV
jgi:N-acylneuraminate cytidylyltransferase